MNRKLLVGISAPRSTLAKRFIKKRLFSIRKYNEDINDYKKFSQWINKNKSINCFVNFAAITNIDQCSKSKNKTLKTNFKSVIKMINIINKSNLINFKYFLAISSSHVFKKKKYKLQENDKKKPDNFYGLTKMLMERDILKIKSNLKFKIGIARIFNFYDTNSKKNFFVEDIKKKISSKKKKLNFMNVNSARDFIHPDDIIGGLSHMIENRLASDYNICSGKSFYLFQIINILNTSNKKITFYGKKNMNLIGSNVKLKKTGWILKNNINYKNLF